MMRRYEHELKKPIRNLVAGDLARCLLIQASKDWGGRVGPREPHGMYPWKAAP